jgi:predicted nucleotidyltransferase
LVQQGIVTASVMGRNKVHELNREHVAADAALEMGGLRLKLWRRLRETLQSWDPLPIYACAFGSAARGDGNEDSDIDILLVHPWLSGEHRPRLKEGSSLATVLEAVASVATKTYDTPANANQWQEQIDDLHGQVQRWTGNVLHEVDISPWQWVRLANDDAGLSEEIRKDSIDLIGSPIAPHFAKG